MYVRITKPSVPFNSIFIFKDSNFLRVCSFAVFNKLCFVANISSLITINKNDNHLPIKT